MSNNTRDIIIQALKNSHNFRVQRYLFDCIPCGEKRYVNQQVHTVAYSASKKLLNEGNPLEHGEIGRVLGKPTIFVNDASIDLIMFEISKELGIKFQKYETRGVKFFYAY